MNNNNKNNALFLAAVLVVGGVLGISSPSLNAFAQEYENYGYEHEEEYDSYDPHQSENKNSKSSSNYLIANCEPSNTVVIGLNQEQTQDILTELENASNSNIKSEWSRINTRRST